MKLRGPIISLAIAMLIALWVFLIKPGSDRLLFNDKGASATSLKFALVVSRSGPGSDIGKSVEQGALRYFAKQTRQQGQEPVSLDTFDDKGDPAEAKRIATDIASSGRYLAVLGHTLNATSAVAAPIYAAAGIPMVSPNADDLSITRGNPWAFSLTMAESDQAKFIASYIKHSLEGKSVLILGYPSNLNARLMQSFQEQARAQRLDVLTHATTKESEPLSHTEIAGIKDVIAASKPDVISVQLNPGHSAEIFVALKDAGYNKHIIGSTAISTPYFARRFAALPKESRSPGFYTNDIMVTTPFLLEISNELAHRENDIYHDRYGHDMSWPFAYGHDTAMVVLESLRRVPLTSGQAGNIDLPGLRASIRQAMASMRAADQGVEGMAGPVYFNLDNFSERPPIFGAFRARSLTSNYNQFVSNVLPLAHYDPLEHTEHIVMDGNVFGLSDIVFSGIRFRQLENLDIATRTFHADFDIWFRYHGNFDPADIIFDNAVEGSLKREILDEHSIAEVKYKLMRVKGDFRIRVSPTDFLQSRTRLALSFKHRLMNRNELIYVVDRSAYNTNKFNVPLMTQMIQDNVLDDALESVLDTATLFEDEVIVRAFGNPTFIDGKLPYSHFNVAVELHHKDLSLPRVIHEWLDTGTILALTFGSAILFLLTGYPSLVRRLGKAIEIPRYLSFAVMLAGLEVMLITHGADIALVDLNTLAMLEKFTESIWYLFGAFISHLLVSRVLWPSLEKSSGYPVPSIARTMVSIVIFLVAAIMIYSAVFGQSVVSIVATSGAITVVLGFALRELIMDFFSGLILNIERPFRIGDFVSFHGGRGQQVEGTIQEMNWRTVRLKDEFGTLVVLPNSKISIENLSNMSVAESVEWKVSIYLDPRYSPETVQPLLEKACEANPHILFYGDQEKGPRVSFRGQENVSGHWVSRYTVTFCMRHMGKKTKATEILWKRIWQSFGEAGINLNPSLNTPDKNPAAFP